MPRRALEALTEPMFYILMALTGGAKFVVMGLLILFSLSVLSVMLRQIYKERVKKRAEAGNGSAKQ